MLSLDHRGEGKFRFWETILRPAEKGDPGDKPFTEDVECVVGLTHGKFVTVVEHCDAVRKLLEQAR
jgi:hypothetical protein